MCLGLVHWEDPVAWSGEGGRRGELGWEIHVNPWLIHVNVWQKSLQYCKEISLQLIKINGKKIKVKKKKSQNHRNREEIDGYQGLCAGRNEESLEKKVQFSVLW